MGGLSGQVLYADEHLLVLEKPSGLLCVPGRGEDKQDCLSARVQREFADALVVHRLDMATSGLWLMSRGVAAQRALGNAFANLEVRKRYVAVVSGRLEGPSEWSLIDLPIAADWPNRPRRIVDPINGKPSQTRWRVVPPAAPGGVPPPPPGVLPPPPLEEGWGGGSTRVELEPLTGRSHQLRVHLQALGHPILGDTLYAPPDVQAQAPRLLLHATQLRFAHPFTGETMNFSSRAPF
jgi:tRNA pseudouridine32 synthase/23S rRNA pseudouridine746 synthase